MAEFQYPCNPKVLHVLTSLTKTSSSDTNDPNIIEFDWVLSNETKVCSIFWSAEYSKSAVYIFWDTQNKQHDLYQPLFQSATPHETLTISNHPQLMTWPFQSLHKAIILSSLSILNNLTSPVFPFHSLRLSYFPNLLFHSYPRKLVMKSR